VRAHLDPVVPFVDLRTSFVRIQNDVLADLTTLLDSCEFTNGPAVRAFEAAFARYVGADHCVGLASGLDALRLALQAADIGEGDEVLVPAMTFVATWEAVSQAGAIPVPVDLSESDYCMDLDSALAGATSRTRAIVPVHLYGQMSDPLRLAELAGGRAWFVLEDACQAHGARRDDVSAGVAGDAAAFSFYPGKNLGAIGDAGALVTNNGDLARRVLALREHGQVRKYEHDAVGWTARLDTIQATVLLRKLPLLDQWNAERRAAAEWYLHALDGVEDLILPSVPDGSAPVWHIFVVRTANPEGLAAHLAERGISTGRHYPEPPHLSQAYSALGYGPGDFPIAETLARECLSLPIYPGIKEEQLEHVGASVRSWFRESELAG
jgi:dTDP-4-amino-4,6-dideoxygalactose transaminase